MKGEIKKLIDLMNNGPVKAYRVSQETGIDQAILSKLKSGKKGVGTLTLNNATKLYNYQKELEMNEMKSPKRYEIVEIVDNKSGKVIAKGKLTAYTPHRVTLEQSYDAKTVHFKGYEPKNIITRD